MKISNIILILLFNCMISKSQIQAVFIPRQTQNAIISYPYSNLNSTPSPVDIVAAYWTGNGTQGAWRSFFKIDLSSIAQNATIDSAFFTFYTNTGSFFGYVGNPNFDNQNAAYICRVTSVWNTNQFNWNGQPTYTTANAAVLNQSVSTTQDYLHIEATALIKDILLGQNNGFAFVLQNEQNYYNSQIFHSSCSPDNNKKPKLTVYYKFPEGLTNFNKSGNEFTYFMKNNYLDLNFKKEFTGSISVFNTLGMLIKKEIISSKKNILLNYNQYSAGIYYVEIIGDKFRQMIKVSQ